MHCFYQKKARCWPTLELMTITSMITLAQISLSHPQLFWWWLVVPMAALLLWSYWRWQQKKLRQLADARLLPLLLVRYQPRRQHWSQALLLAALALLCTALLNPQTPGKEGNNTLRGIELILAIDVSNSMNATDMGTSRLEAVQKIARQLIDTLPGSQIGIIAFAGEAYLQLPLTPDLAAARMLLATLDESSAPEPGSNLANALQVAYQSFPIAHRAHKAVILFTDGEALEGDATAVAPTLRQAGILLVAAGTGTTQGTTLTAPNGQPQMHENGTPVISRLQPESLTKLANAAGGKYISLHQNPKAFTQLLAQLEMLPLQPLQNSYLTNFTSYGYGLLILAFLLLFISTHLQTGAITRQKKATTQTVFLAICIVLLHPIASKAQKNQPMLTQANELMQAGKTAEAADLYRQLLQQQPNMWQAQLNLGNIAYRNAQYTQALQHYQATLQQTLPKDAMLIALNNKGLAQAKLNKPEDAVASFKLALHQSPFDEGIQNNLNMALEEVASKQKQQKTSPNRKPLNQQKAADKIQALQQEEEKIRQQMKQQKKSAKLPEKNSW